MFIGGEKSEKCYDFDTNNENTSEIKTNFNNHYHLVERNTTALNIMSGIKSLVCDLNGIIIAEMVYRCMICDVVYETIPEVQIHYQTKHIEQDNLSTNTSNTSTKSSNSTNVSFLSSFQLPTDPILDNIPDSPNPQTLTFDVPSGLKTLHQQFEGSSKVTHQKKKSTKSLASNHSKTKIGFNQRSKGLSHMTGPTIKSGFITCEICGATKFYKYTQRRFGVYSCVGCAKFYSKYLIKPVAYKMCENLGKCNLKVSECEPYGRCKACLIHKCRSKFIIDPKKLNNYRNESKGTKTNSKQISEKNVKSSKLSNSVSLEPKTKNNGTPTKPKNDPEGNHSNKMSASHLTHKKSKSDKIQTKNIDAKNPIYNKKSPNSGGQLRGTTDKISTLIRIKKHPVKSPDLQSKRTRNNLFCRKCLISKAKTCSHCGTGLDTHKLKNTDKTRLSVKSTQCLTRSKNK